MAIGSDFAQTAPVDPSQPDTEIETKPQPELQLELPTQTDHAARRPAKSRMRWPLLAFGVLVLAAATAVWWRIGAPGPPPRRAPTVMPRAVAPIATRSILPSATSPSATAPDRSQVHAMPAEPAPAIVAEGFLAETSPVQPVEGSRARATVGQAAIASGEIKSSPKTAPPANRSAKAEKGSMAKAPMNNRQPPLNRDLATVHPDPAPARKSGSDLYNAARDEMLAGHADEAVALFKRAVMAGNKKAYGQLARIFFQRGSRGECAVAARKYLVTYPDARDAQPMQGLLDKCSN